MPRTPDTPNLPGFRKQWRCNRGKGTVRLWYLEDGAPFQPGPNGEKWVCEWEQPGGESKIVHAANLRLGMSLCAEIKAGKTNVFAKSREQTVSHQAETHAPPSSPITSVQIRTSEALQKRFDDERIADLIEDGLKAEKAYLTKEGLEYSPDWTARLNFAKLLLAYRDGTPIQRIEQKKTNSSSDADVMAKLATKPGYRKGMQAWLDALDAKQRDTLNALDAAKKGKVAMEAEAVEVSDTEEVGGNPDPLSPYPFG